MDGVGKEGDGTVYVENTFDEEGRVRTQIENGKKEEISSFTYTENEEDETTTVTMTNGDGTTEQAVSDKYGQGIQYIDAIGGMKNLFSIVVTVLSRLEIQVTNMMQRIIVLQL